MTITERIPYAAQRTLWALEDSGSPLYEKPERIILMLIGRALHLLEHNEQFAQDVASEVKGSALLDSFMLHWAQTFLDPMNEREKVRGLYRLTIKPVNTNEVEL